MIGFDPGTRADRWLLSCFVRSLGPIPVHFALRHAEALHGAEGNPVASVRIGDRRTVAALLVEPEVAFGDAYSDGRIEVSGDLAELLAHVYRTGAGSGRGLAARIVSRFQEWLQANSPRGSRKNIHQHYDLGTEFFRLWLDEQLVYTCAYYPAATATLEEAQRAKMDYVCRKLQLRRGETVVEAGCGWGSLALHMARHYGVRVRAFNISQDQIAYARKAAAEQRLAGAVEFVQDDYRNISGRYDAFVSLGMVEHVGRAHYREFGDVVWRTVGRTGRGLLHFIGRNQPAPFSAWIRRRIFPGAYAPALGEVTAMLARHDFSVLDVENLRLHYARTLEAWRERFERSYETVAGRFDARFARAWRLYLCGSIAAFRMGALQLFQVVFAGTDSAWKPMTRAHLYAAERDETWIGATS